MPLGVLEYFECLHVVDLETRLKIVDRVLVREVGREMEHVVEVPSEYAFELLFVKNIPLNDSDVVFCWDKLIVSRKKLLRTAISAAS